MSKQIPFYVQSPLPEAARWIGGLGRDYDGLTIKKTTFETHERACGIACTLAGNVKIEMRYGYDAERGFHVIAIRGQEHRAYIKEGLGQKKGVAAAGGGPSAMTDYRKALASMDDRYKTDSAEAVANAFLAGQF